MSRDTNAAFAESIEEFRNRMVRDEVNAHESIVYVARALGSMTTLNAVLDQYVAERDYAVGRIQQLFLPPPPQQRAPEAQIPPSYDVGDFYDGSGGYPKFMNQRS